MAAKYDIEIIQGETFEIQFVWKDETNTPVPLTGYTARMHIRDTPESSAIMLDCSSFVTLGPTDGEVNVEIPAASTATLKRGINAYDIELTSGSFVKVLVGGDATVLLKTTR